MSEYFYNIYDTIKTMVSGMSLTLHHLRNKKDLVATLQYPNEKWPLPERNIGFDHKEYNVIRSRLHVDIDDCIGCLMCEKACPVDCIKIDTIKPPKDSDYDCGITSHDTQKKMIVPRFSIDMSECMYCNLCVYPCPEECIYMVGGPNEPKHEIDYEFSKYVKHDLVFEFSNTTEQDIVNIGAQSYLDKRKEKEENMLKGQKLEGINIDEVIESSKDEDKKTSKHLDSAFVLFKNVTDKMSRGIAKKAFTSAKRNNLDMNGIADNVANAINSYNKMSDEMKNSIASIRIFKYPEENKIVEIEQTVDNKISKQNIPSSNKNNLFDIKVLNEITDKMVRGSLKKIYMSGKRSGVKSNDLAEEMITYLKENKKDDDDIILLLNNLKISDLEQSTTINDNEDEKNTLEVLFDIKKLNDIDDKMVRGTSKKVYMGGKRAGKKSEEVIKDIRDSINASGKMTSEIEELLGGLLK